MESITEQVLLDLKKKIEESKTKSAELTGSQKHLMKTLKEDWNCDDIEQADVKIAKMDNDIEELDESIEKGIKELKTKYDFENESIITQD